MNRNTSFVSKALKLTAIRMIETITITHTAPPIEY